MATASLLRVVVSRIRGEVCALMAAGSNPNPKVLAVLLESGFDPDGGRWTTDDLLRSAAAENRSLA